MPSNVRHFLSSFSGDGSTTFHWTFFCDTTWRMSHNTAHGSISKDITFANFVNSTSYIIVISDGSFYIHNTVKRPPCKSRNRFWSISTEHTVSPQIFIICRVQAFLPYLHSPNIDCLCCVARVGCQTLFLHFSAPSFPQDVIYLRFISYLLVTTLPSFSRHHTYHLLTGLNKLRESVQVRFFHPTFLLWVRLSGMCRGRFLRKVVISQNSFSRSRTLRSCLLPGSLAALLNCRGSSSAMCVSRCWVFLGSS